MYINSSLLSRVLDSVAAALVAAVFTAALAFLLLWADQGWGVGFWVHNQAWGRELQYIFMLYMIMNL